jgi:hypothetical protein
MAVQPCDGIGAGHAGTECPYVGGDSRGGRGCGTVAAAPPEPALIITDSDFDAAQLVRELVADDIMRRMPVKSMACMLLAIEANSMQAIEANSSWQLRPTA